MQVRLSPVEGDNALYTVNIPAKHFQEDILSAGLHLDIRSTADVRSCAAATAIIDRLDCESKSITLFFVDSVKLAAVLSISRTVNIGMNTSSFVYRSELRSIDFVAHWKYLENIVYPKPNFTEVKSLLFLHLFIIEFLLL